MGLKWTITGAFLYAAMAAWVLSLAGHAAAWACRRRGALGLGKILGRLGWAFGGLGFAILAAGFIYRWIDVRHLPLQSMFEVFLALGMLTFPLGLFCQKFLRAQGPAASAAMGLIVLVPPAFVFQATPQMLPPALRSWLFLPHVGAYLLAYVILVMAGVQAMGCLLADAMGQPEAAIRRELATYRLVRLGFPLLLLGLVLGAVWGKLAWGDYWNWDPKELWSLATFLIYVAYLHVRGLFGGRARLANSALAALGVAGIAATVLWVNLSRFFLSLHAYAR
ncbi:MAG: cytochrome c biogenesis protein CcsA [Phycisphaerae bacterium]